TASRSSPRRSSTSSASDSTPDPDAGPRFRRNGIRWHLMSRLPTIHRCEAAELGQYSLEKVHLEFSNGERRLYERLHSRTPGSVIIAAMPDPDTVLPIREYAVGTHRYVIGLAQGRMAPRASNQ